MLCVTEVLLGPRCWRLNIFWKGIHASQEKLHPFGINLCWVNLQLLQFQYNTKCWQPYLHITTTDTKRIFYTPHHITHCHIRYTLLCRHLRNIPAMAFDIRWESRPCCIRLHCAFIKVWLFDLFKLANDVLPEVNAWPRLLFVSWAALKYLLCGCDHCKLFICLARSAIRSLVSV